MLQRAASNAYSWWWAGHIRTKQSKWLEQSLQDMEEKVQYVLKLIEEDGDSFAKRAEMYYKKRPELIYFVEESYRAFRALAERYDHLSTELQNANNTLATCFPDQIQLKMDEDDEFGTPRPRIPPQVPAANASSVPEVPKAPTKDLKGLIQKATKHHLQTKKSSKADAKSGLSKADAVAEIDKLQKDILALQTQKEFIKSSYQSGLQKYWNIENQIMEKQQRVCKLQDEFGSDKVIDDDEARKLMADTALKSCQETLAQLQETQQKSVQVAREENKKIEDARQKLKSLRHEFLHDQTDEEKPHGKDDSTKTGKVMPSSSQDLDEVIHEKQKMEVIQEKIKKQFDASSTESITVTELVEKIDELVNEVVSLETAVSCQTVLIDRLRSESNELHAQIRTLEDDRTTLHEGTHDLHKKVKELEEKLNGIQDLNQNVEKENSNFQTHFAEAQSGLDHLSEKLSRVKPDNELDIESPSQDKERFLLDNAPQKEQEKQKDPPSGGNPSLKPSKIGDVDVKDEQDFGASANGQEGEGKKSSKKTVTFLDPKPQDNMEEQKTATSLDPKPQENMEKQKTATSLDPKPQENMEKKTVTFLNPKPQETMEEQLSIQSENSLKAEPKAKAENEELNWQMVLLTGEEDKEKILLSEYTSILKNYKDVKKKLSDMEKKERDGQFEELTQIQELKSAIAKRDGEIQRLHHKLNSLQGSLGENKDVKESYSPTSDPLKDQSIKPKERTEDAVLEENNTSLTRNKEDEDINLFLIDHPAAMSHVEEKLRMDIDAILEENLDFWLRFSTAFHQIQKFKSTVEDLQHEISKIREKKKQEDSVSNVKSDVRPIYKHLKETETELKVWLEQSVSLKDELERRLSSLNNIQEKITIALREGVEEEEIKFSSHQAAKFQGEVLNMKQENNKVKEELQAGVDHITSLQVEVDKTLKKLNEEFGVPGDQSQFRHPSSRTSIPLRSFIFGTKPKKQKSSIFSVMQSNRKYQVLRAGVPL